MDNNRNADRMPSVGKDKEELDNEGFSYDGLCISSGGYKGINALGALAVWEMYGYFKRTRWFAGCSVGSIITLLLACGWTPIALYKQIVNLKLFHGIGDIDTEKFKSSYGLVSNETLREELEKLVLMKRKKIPTFMDFHKEGIYIGFSITDRRTKEGYKLDHTTYPTMLSTDGALMSSNIPFMFPPIEFNGMEVIDGALTNPFPIDYIDGHRLRILGVALYGEASEDRSFVNFLSDTIMIPIEKMQRRSCLNASRHVTIVEMMVKELSLIDTNASYTLKNDLFFKGMEDAKALVNILNKKYKHRKPKPMKPNVRTPLKEIPVDVLIKCLICQPVDVLCQSSVTSEKTLLTALETIPKEKWERLKQFARQVIMDEVKAGVYVKHEEARYETQESVHISENHSQKLYDTLPLQFKAAARVVMDSMSAQQASDTIKGVNIVLEGLNRLGIDLIGGLMLGGPTLNVEERRTTDGATRIEEIEENENQVPAKPRNKMEEID